MQKLALSNNENAVDSGLKIPPYFLLITVYLFSSISISRIGNRIQHKLHKSGGKMESRAKAVSSREAYWIQHCLLPTWFGEEFPLFASELHDKHHNPYRAGCLYHVCH